MGKESCQYGSPIVAIDVVMKMLKVKILTLDFF